MQGSPPNRVSPSQLETARCGRFATVVPQSTAKTTNWHEREEEQQHQEQEEKEEEKCTVGHKH